MNNCHCDIIHTTILILIIINRFAIILFGNALKDVYETLIQCEVHTYSMQCIRSILMTMDYSPWVEREIWPFLKVPISPKPKRSRPPKLVHMYVTSTPTCMKFLSRFQSIKIFGDHGL